MPADMYSVNRTKELIISFIRARGPSLPVHIARDVKTSPLFAAAFLSELYNEGKIKMTSMKIGSSSLYYLADQSSQLENYFEYLNPREKEAFNLLKKEKMVDDEKLEPVMRVALRALKDFAIPIKGTEEGKIRWKYYLASEEVPVEKSPPKTEEPKKVESTNYEKTITEEKPQEKTRSPRPRIQKEERKEVKFELHFQSSPAPAAIPEFPFTLQVKEYLTKRNMDILQTLESSKKEFKAKIRLATPIGLQEFLVVAKDKKRLKEDEIIDALKQAHAIKMPALVLAPGDLEKKAQNTLEEWRNLIKFEKIQ